MIMFERVKRRCFSSWSSTCGTELDDSTDLNSNFDESFDRLQDLSDNRPTAVRLHDLLMVYVQLS